MICPRPYGDDSDWKRICKLLIEGRRANNGTYYIHTSDFSWWMYHPDVGSRFSKPGHRPGADEVRAREDGRARDALGHSMFQRR
jgi:hypothetical protein